MWKWCQTCGLFLNIFSLFNASLLFFSFFSGIGELHGTWINTKEDDPNIKYNILMNRIAYWSHDFLYLLSTYNL